MLIPLSRDTAALVMQDDGEIGEYAAAVIETMEGEGIAGLTAGIGTLSHGLSDLKRSFVNASEALETGRNLRQDRRLFSWSDLMLDTMIRMIPRENRESIFHRMTAAWNEAGLNGELMETAEAFFTNDLNLTATSREMFIHRNTLNYRLEKIRKATGLDLQRFRDAAVFRILIQMKNDEESKEN